MTKFSPKIEIINHFDNLINRVDIDIDICLEKYDDEISLGELLISSEYNRKNFRDRFDSFMIKFYHPFNPFENQTLDLWTEATKVIDYLKQVRMKTIEELRKAQEDTLEYYKLNSWRFKSEQSNVKNNGWSIRIAQILNAIIFSKHKDFDKLFYIFELYLLNVSNILVFIQIETLLH